MLKGYKKGTEIKWSEDQCLFLVYGAKVYKKRFIVWQTVFMTLKNRFQINQTVLGLQKKFDRLKNKQKDLYNLYERLIEKHFRLIEDFVTQNKCIGTVVQALEQLGPDTKSLVLAIRSKITAFILIFYEPSQNVGWVRL